MNGNQEITPFSPPDSAAGHAVTQSIVRAEIDVQIATAHAYGRNPTSALKNAQGLCTATPEDAEDCYYILGRGDKKIDGPSIGLARRVASCWGNLRIGARLISIDEHFVHVEGVAHDLEANVYYTAPVSRRITDRNGRRYNDDMIQVTVGAARSIAVRNAILFAVPISHVVYKHVLGFLQGTEKGLPERRKACIEAFKAIGVDVKQLLANRERKHADDLNGADIFELRGIYQAIREGMISKDAAFAEEEKAPVGAATEKAQVLADKMKRAKKEVQEAAKEAGLPPTDIPPPVLPEPPDEPPAYAPPPMDLDPAPVADDPITIASFIDRVKGHFPARPNLTGMMLRRLLGDDYGSTSQERLDASFVVLTSLENRWLDKGQRPRDAVDLYRQIDEAQKQAASGF